MPSKRNGFTALRLLAAFLVLVTHSYVMLGWGEEDPLSQLTHLVSLSSLGVDMFFAISGYLICGSLLRTPSALSYLINRCLRILPALAVVIGLSVFVMGPLLTVSSHYWTSLQTYQYFGAISLYLWQAYLPGVFTGNPVTVINGSLWTLPLEFTCYLVLLAMSWCGALNWRGLALLTAASLLLHLADAFLGGQTLLGMPLLHLNRLGTIFLGGALLATLGERVTYSRGLASAAGGLILVSLWWGRADWHRFAAIYIVLLPYVTVAIAMALRRLDWLNRWDISYGIYLYAFVVQQCVVLVLGPAISVLLLTLVATAVTIACATASWFLVEQPALVLKSRLSARMPPTAAVATT